MTVTAEKPAETKPINPQDPLGGIELAIPEKSKELTRLYLCGLKLPEDMAHLDLRPNVGLVCFAKETFRWEGKGENAKQIFNNGALVRLSDRQVAEVRAKLQFLYVRKVVKDGKVQGVQFVEATDGGVRNNPAWAGGDKGNRAPELDASRLNGTETPLKDLIFMKLVPDNYSGGKSMTKEQLLSLLAELEAEEQRTLSEGTFAELEGGKGGLMERARRGRDPKEAHKTTTTDGVRKAEAGYLPGK